MWALIGHQCGAGEAMNRVIRLMMLLPLLWVSALQADELRPAYLQLQQVNPQTFEVIWRLPALGDNRKLALDVSFGEDAEVITKPQALPVAMASGNSTYSRWQMQRAQGLEGLSVTINGLSRTNSEVLLRLEYLDGTSATHRLTPDAPQYTVPLKPSWGQTLQTYFVLGVEHIWFGIDHLLLVFALLLLVRDIRKLVWTITAFTLAHSITLIMASMAWVSLPIPPIEACIALSIAFIAAEVLRVQQGGVSLTQQRPWLVAFGFGLLHGLGFAAALSEIGLPQNALVPALVVFNLGVEAGQLVFVVCVLLLWRAVDRPLALSQWPPSIRKIPTYLVGSLAAFWTIERVLSFGF